MVEVLDLPAVDLDHLLTKFSFFFFFFNKWLQTDGDDYEPDTLSGLQRGM